MKQQILRLDYLPTDLNRYIAADRSNRYAGGAIKKDETERVYSYCLMQGLKPMKSPVALRFNWIVKNKRKDKDNIAFSKKYIIDGLVLAKVLSNDGWNDIASLYDSFVLSENEGVVVTLEEV